jgi:probable F420-dependent oxidoreductase
MIFFKVFIVTLLNGGIIVKFGISLPHYGKYGSKKAIRMVSEFIDNNENYKSLWVADHIMVPNTSLHQHHWNFYEGLSVMSYVSAITHQVQLGTSTIVVSRRNPMILAKEISTIDNLSNGRIILGLGAGWSVEEARLVNADFVNRWELLDEGVKVMKTLWRSHNADFDGKFFKFYNGVFQPLPVQKGGPPIWLSGNLDRIIKRVVEYADGWNPAGISPEELKKGVSKIKKHAKRKITISMRNKVTITSSPEGWGSVRAERKGLQAIEGDENIVKEQLEQYEKAGLDYLICYFGSVPADTYLDRIKTCAEVVIPSFKD